MPKPIKLGGFELVCSRTLTLNVKELYMFNFRCFNATEKIQTYTPLLYYAKFGHYDIW